LGYNARMNAQNSVSGPLNMSLLFRLAGLFLGLVMLAACAAEPPPVGDSTPTAVPAAVPAALSEQLNLRISQDISFLRPWQPRSRDEELMIGLLYNGLMRITPSMQAVPDLAADVQTSPDGKTLTFRLLPGLRWHDGLPLTSADVVATLTYLRALPLDDSALLQELATIAAISAPDEATVVIELYAPSAPLLSMLAVPILPQHILATVDVRTADLLQTPVGSGPFRLTQRMPGASYVFERNTDFHRGAPNIGRIALVVAPDPTVAAQALQDGSLDLAELPWEVRRTLRDAPGLTLAAYPENGFYFLGFNLREGRPFSDLRVRQALAAAIDLRGLAVIATGEVGRPIGNSALPGSWADQLPADESPADLERAASLLDASGWLLPAGAAVRERDGRPLQATLYVRGDDARRVAAAQTIAATSARVGFAIQVQAVDYASVLLARYAPPFDFDLLLGGWSNGAASTDFADTLVYDPDDSALFSAALTAGSGPTRNIVGFADAQYDAAADASRAAYDLTTRAAAIATMQQRLRDELPYLFLWADQQAIVAVDRLTTLDGPPDFSSPRYFAEIERWYLLPQP
jgi:peptide/nickel transport system substrate-binding protein